MTRPAIRLNYVAHDRRQLTVHSRQGSQWVVREVGPGRAAALPAVDCSLDVDELNRDPLA